MLSPCVAQAQTPDGYANRVKGEWKVSYEYSGTAEGKAGYNFSSYPELGYISEPFSYDMASDTATKPFAPREHMGDNAAVQNHPIHQQLYDYFEFNHAGLGAGASRQSANISSLGAEGEVTYKPTIKVVWDWVPSAGYTDAGPVPEFINFVVTGEASASTNGNSNNKPRNDFSYGTYYSHIRNTADVWNGTGSIEIVGLDAPAEDNMGDDDTSGGDPTGGGSGGSGGSALMFGGSGGTSSALTAGALTTGGGADDDLVTTQDGTANTWSRKRSHLFTIETRGRTHIDDAAPIDFNVKAQIKGERHDIMKNGPGNFSYAAIAGSAQAGATLIAAQDDRTVALEREGARNEYVTTVGGVKVTHGDTIYSFTEHHSLDTPKWVPVPQKFVSILGGKWSRKLLAATSGGYDITWNWRGDGKLESYNNPLTLKDEQAAANSYTRWNELSRVSPKGELEPWYNFGATAPPTYTDEGATKRGGRPPTTTTMKYFARDNQTKTLAEARYELTIHEPVELDATPKEPNPKLVGTGDVNEPLMTTVNGVRMFVAFRRATAATGDITNVGSFTMGTATVHTEGKSWGVEISGSVEIAKIFNLGGGFNGQKSWEDSVEFNQSDAPVWPALKVGQSTILYFQIAYDLKEAKYRRYNGSGELRSSASAKNVSVRSVPYVYRYMERKGASKNLYFKVFEALQSEPTQGNQPPIYGIPSDKLS